MCRSDSCTSILKGEEDLNVKNMENAHTTVIDLESYAYIL